MAFPCITKFRGDKKGVNAQRKNTCTQMRSKTSSEAHKPETKPEATLLKKKACQKSHRNFLLLKKLQDMSDKVKKKQKHFKLIVEKFSSFH